jgi:hypothetical protein
VGVGYIDIVTELDIVVAYSLRDVAGGENDFACCRGEIACFDSWL